MNKIWLAAAVAPMALMFAATPAAATVLVSGSGWQDDTLTGIGNPTTSSPWTFTVAVNSILSVTDDFVTGDIYTLSGGITGVTTFYAGSPTDVQATGSHGPAWLNSSYSKIAKLVGPGSYSFSITGNGAGGIPAGLGLRLDAARGVPEPAAWALMLGGFGFVGGALRARARKVKFVTA